MKNIVLIVMMGCVKTTISQLLGEKLKREVIDIDQYLIEKHGCSISDMMSISEDHFRDLEQEACLELSKKEGVIISTGGGVIKRQENIDALKKNGIIIYLDRPIQNILTDIDTQSRPLLKDGPEKLYQLDKERRQLYMNACDIHIINDQSLEMIVNLIISKVG